MKLLQTPWYNDVRSKRFSHNIFFGSTSPLLLPKSLNRPRGPVLNQTTETTRCTGYGSAANGYYIHGKKMSADWSAYKIGKKQGRSVDNGGGDPNATMRHMRDDGFLPEIKAPFSLERDGLVNSGFFAPWPESLDKEAAKFDNSPAFLKVDGPYDIFDNIRGALWDAYDEKTKRGACVDAFSGWYAEWEGQTIIPEGKTLMGYHRYVFIDWIYIENICYLIAQQSYGTQAGDSGYLYFPREVVNKEFSQRNRTLKILKTLSKEQIEWAKKETPFGRLQRAINDCWYAISELLVTLRV